MSVANGGMIGGIIDGHVLDNIARHTSDEVCSCCGRCPHCGSTPNNSVYPNYPSTSVSNSPSTSAAHTLKIVKHAVFF